MRKISKPNFDIEKIVLECSASFQDENIRDNYKNCAKFIADESGKYDMLGNQQLLHSIKTHNKVNSILFKSDMESLYTNKFAKHISVRPKYYDILKLSSFGICPICGEGVVSNLDHYLPKATYPTYAVTPFNLAPICRDCNYNKGENEINDFISSPFHPYYDFIDDIIWLVAKLQVKNDQLVAQFCVNYEIKLEDNVLYNRLYKHFKLYKLDEVYSIRSVTIIADSRKSWVERYNLKGKEMLLDDLRQDLESCENNFKNSLKATVLRALIDNIDVLSELSNGK